MLLSEDQIKTIHEDVDHRGFTVFRPDGFKATCELARKEYFKAFEEAEMQPPRKSFSYPDLKNGPWRKLAISSTNGIGEPYAQFLQSLYFDPFNTTFTNLNKIFRATIEIRNQLMGIKLNFGDNPIDDGFWNACRVHHYPSGGGFMVMHSDTFFPVAVGEKSFYQLLVPLSIKGEDFDTGGGVVVDKQGAKFNIDDPSGVGGIGSILIYDGRTRHGVEDVDPDQIVSLDNKKGRLAVLSSPYCTVIPKRIDGK